MFVHAIRKPSFVILFVSLMLYCNATNGEEDSEKGNAQRPNVKQYTIEELLRTTSFVGASFSPDNSKILKISRVDEFTPPAEQQNTSIPALKIVETGEVFEDLASFDELMRNFLRENEIPGAALAVAKDGRLMYSRGFGYADVEKKQRVEPDSLFRIASISKPITAIAIMRLVDEGRLKLDDRVFDLLSYKPHLPNGSEIDPRLKKITIRHLLQHTAGWDRDVSIDPMFHSTEIAHSLGVPTPAKPDDIIRFMMGWELDFDPGTRYAYSNFGYCLLGRVIEKITKEDYEEHVRNTVLAPIGVHSTRIGKTLREGRANNEVCYYA
ncbi:MAG: beta-lactamase family protein, partial [Planctomycetes bacterium]|nr:beta-lactamase family protein [Planctomycetota bacterium]